MKEKIIAVCEKLSRAGINPTAERVRTELGGGSFTTITPILKEWKSTQKKVEPTPDIPPEALKAVHQATSLIWSIANEHHAEALNAVKQEYHRNEQELIIERDEAMREITTLEMKLQTLEEHARTLSEANAAKEAELNALRLEIQKQQFTIETLTQTAQDLKTELKTAKKEAETAQAQALKEKNGLELQIHKQQLSLDEYQRNTEKLKAENADLREKTETAQNEASRLAGMLEGFTAKPIAPKPASEDVPLKPKPNRKPTQKLQE